MKRARKLIAVVLALALCLGLTVPAAAAENTAGVIAGTASYRSNVTRMMNSFSYTFRQEWFREDPDKVNPSLALLSMQLAATAFYPETAQRFLEDLGFLTVAEGYGTSTDEEIAVVSGVRLSGNQPPLVVIAPQSDGYDEEGWAQNMRVGASGDHEGWSKAADYILENVMPRYYQFGNAIVWVVGYSRGGGVANLVASRLARGRLYDSRLFCYTFETGSTTDSDRRSRAMYDCIHNYVDHRDLVTRVPLESWGMGRYGQEHDLCTGEDGQDDEDLMKILEQLNPYAPQLVEKNPSTKTVGGKSVSQYLDEFTEALAKAMPTRADYVATRRVVDEETGETKTFTYQDALISAARGLNQAGILDSILDITTLGELIAAQAKDKIRETVDSAKQKAKDFAGSVWEKIAKILPQRDDRRREVFEGDGAETEALLREVVLEAISLRSGDAQEATQARKVIKVLADALNMGDRPQELEGLVQLLADDLQPIDLDVPEMELEAMSLRELVELFGGPLLKGLLYGRSLTTGHYNDVVLAELICQDTNEDYTGYENRGDQTINADVDRKRSGASVMLLDPTDEIWAAPSLAWAPTVVIDLAGTPASAYDEEDWALVCLPISNIGPTVTAFEQLEDGTMAPIKQSVTLSDGLYFWAYDDMVIKIVDNRQPLADVPGNKWYLGSAQWAASHEIMKGVGNWLFAPEKKLTRGTMAQVLYSLSGDSAEDLPCEFSDVSKLSWYRDAVAWASANGVMVGYPDGTFRGDDLLTREQMVAALYRYFDVEYAGSTSVLSGFVDADEISQYAKIPMAWAVSEGIISGTSQSRLSPKHSATRAQISSILMRMFVSPDETLEDVIF